MSHNHNQEQEESKGYTNNSADRHYEQLDPDKPIDNLDRKLTEPMVPPIDKWQKKFSVKFPPIFQKFGAFVALFFAILYAALGLHGVLIFSFGVLAVLAVEGALLVRYFANENKRASKQRKLLENQQKQQNGGDPQLVTENNLHISEREEEKLEILSIGEQTEAKNNVVCNQQDQKSQNENNESGIELGNNCTNQVKLHGSRLLKRPSFLVQDFEAPDSFDYFMVHECDCQELRIQEIERCFTLKSEAVLQNFQSFSDFFMQLGRGFEQLGQQFSQLGAPARSFLSGYTESLIFEKEEQILDEIIPENLNHPCANILFKSIRRVIQHGGKRIENLGTDMKEKMISGELRNLEEELTEWSADFENRYKLQSSKFLDAVQDLHAKETTYKQIEDELQDLISQFQYLTAKQSSDEKEQLIDESKTVGQAAQASSASAASQTTQTSNSTSTDVKKSKSYSQVVIVESQCKIKHYELNTKAYEIRDAYNELTEVLERADSAKRDLSERLKQIVHRKSLTILTILSSFIIEAKQYDVQILADIDKLCQKQPPSAVSKHEEKSTRLSPSKMLQMKKQQSEELIWGQDSDMSEENMRSAAKNFENQGKDYPNTIENVEMEEVKMMPYVSSQENTPKSSQNGEENEDGVPMIEEVDVEEIVNSPPAKIPNENTNNSNEKEEDSFDEGCQNQKSPRRQAYSMMPSQQVEAHRLEKPQISPRKSSFLAPVSSFKLEQCKREDESQKNSGKLSKNFVESQQQKPSLQNLSFADLSSQEMGAHPSKKINDFIKKSSEMFKTLTGEFEKDEKNFKQKTSCLSEFIFFVDQLAETNKSWSDVIRDAVASQYKEVKFVQTGGSISIENIQNMCDVAIRSNLESVQQIALTKTDSKKYVNGIQTLKFKTDFADLDSLWQEHLDDHLLIADQFSVSEQQLKTLRSEVQDYRGMIEGETDELCAPLKEVGESIGTSIARSKQIMTKLNKLTSELAQKEKDAQELKQREEAQTNQDEQEDNNQTANIPDSDTQNKVANNVVQDYLVEIPPDKTSLVQKQLEKLDEEKDSEDDSLVIVTTNGQSTTEEAKVDVKEIENYKSPKNNQIAYLKQVEISNPFGQMQKQFSFEMRSPVTPKLANELSSAQKLQSKLRTSLGGEDQIQIFPPQRHASTKIQLKPIFANSVRKLSLDDEVFKKRELERNDHYFNKKNSEKSQDQKSNSFATEHDESSKSIDETSFGRLGADLAFNKQKSMQKQRANSVNGDDLPQQQANDQVDQQNCDKEKVEVEKEGGGWWSYIVSPVSLIGQVFTSTEEAVSIEQLEKALTKEVQEIDSSLKLYQNQINQIFKHLQSKRKEMQRSILDWKQDLIDVVRKQAEACQRYKSETQITEAKLDEVNLDKEMISLKVPTILDSKDQAVAIHRPHCLNYRLIPGCSAEGGKKDSQNSQNTIPMLPITNSATKNSQTSSTPISNNRQLPLVASEIPNLSKNQVGQREKPLWLNDLLSVLYEAWSDGSDFKNLVLQAIQEEVNEDRDSSLAEIRCIGMKLEGKAPRINWVKHVKNAEGGSSTTSDNLNGGFNSNEYLNNDNRSCFTVDLDAEVPGCVKILIETAYKINWPAENWVTIPLTLEIAVSRISGKLRLQFANDIGGCYGGSYLQFLGKPAVTIVVEPVVGNKSQINLTSIPTVKSLIKGILNDVVESLCYPNKVPIVVPLADIVKKQQKTKAAAQV